MRHRASDIRQFAFVHLIKARPGKIDAFVAQEAAETSATLTSVGQPPPTADEISQRKEALYASAEDAARMFREAAGE